MLSLFMELFYLKFQCLHFGFVALLLHLNVAKEFWLELIHVLLDTLEVKLIPLDFLDEGVLLLSGLCLLGLGEEQLLLQIFNCHFLLYRDSFFYYF